MSTNHRTLKKLRIIPSYLVDDFVVYTLKLTEKVPTESHRDPLAVHYARSQQRNPNNDSREMELIRFDRAMTPQEVADALDIDGYRPADYGELKGYWYDSSVEDSPVMAVPSKEDLANRIWFYDEKGPLALAITRHPGTHEPVFATTNLSGLFDPDYLFLVAKK